MNKNLPEKEKILLKLSKGVTISAECANNNGLIKEWCISYLKRYTVNDLQNGLNAQHINFNVSSVATNEDIYRQNKYDSDIKIKNGNELDFFRTKYVI